jgi:tRNA-dihydrouridine synthase B
MKHLHFLERIRGSKLLMPPLAGYTDPPYRAVMTRFNPPFIVTEMISASAIVRRGVKTLQMMKKVGDACLKGVQLVGEDPTVMSEAATVVEDLGFDYVDINMGCTIGKVARSGAGISLMKDECRAINIAAAVVEAVRIPVTCKIRLGGTRNCRNAVPLSLLLADSGVAAITVHGRSGEKKLGLPVDYDGIKEVVDQTSLPIIANGGIFTGNDAITMIQRTGASAVMPGRGIIGNPWLITEILAILSGARYSPPSLQEKKDVCLIHLDYLSEFYGEKGGVLRMRKILPEYFSGIHRVKDLKQDVLRVTTAKEVVTLIDRVQEGSTHLFYGIHH